MSESIQLTRWAGVQLYEELVVLGDDSHEDLIRQAFEAFKPYALYGTILEARPEIHRVVGELIAAGDFIYLEPALYTRQFQGRDWDELTLSDGGFVLQCFPWATQEEWLSFMPWMMSFVLRANQFVDPVQSFLYSLKPSNVSGGKGWSDLLSDEASSFVVAFLDRLYAKYTAEFGPIESYGDGYSLLVELIELRDAWALRLPPN